MKIISDIEEMRFLAQGLRCKDKTVGFVPTMGYLHEGHLSLMRAARERCDVLIVSIFVNPAQFSPDEDYEQYPRDMEHDSELCRQESVDILFVPTTEDMYPEKFSTYANAMGEMVNVLCGYFRPGYFRGVTTIVAKLLNIVQPHFAVFGQKDGQQLVVIRKMVRELNFPVEIVAAPTVREPDGLAMSSRNKYLTPEERKVAQTLYESLLMAERMVKQGGREPAKIVAVMEEFIEKSGLFKIQYINVVDAETLEPKKHIDGKIMIALAAFLGKARLIDNIMIDIPED